MSDSLKVAVSGSSGRMGSAACTAIETAEGLELVGRADPESGTTLSEALESAEVLVDLTRPDAAPANALEAAEHGVHCVVGTTGFDLDDLRSRIESTEGQSRCLVVPNFAIGAVLMMRFAAAASKYLGAVEIVEMHHPGKVDAPSGTALRTAEMISEMGGEVAEPIHSIRLPGLVAHQEVMLGGEGETLTIRHDAIDRSCFMPGILLAVRKVASLPQRFSVGLESVLDDAG